MKGIVERKTVRNKLYFAWFDTQMWFAGIRLPLIQPKNTDKALRTHDVSLRVNILTLLPCQYSSVCSVYTFYSVFCLLPLSLYQHQRSLPFSLSLAAALRSLFACYLLPCGVFVYIFARHTNVFLQSVVCNTTFYPLAIDLYCYQYAGCFHRVVCLLCCCLSIGNDKPNVCWYAHKRSWKQRVLAAELRRFKECRKTPTDKSILILYDIRRC